MAPERQNFRDITIFLERKFNSSWIFARIYTDGFSRSLITDLRLDLENSKWRIHNGGENSKKVTDSCRILFVGVLWVANYRFSGTSR